MLILCVNMQFVWIVSLAHTISARFFLPAAYVTIISLHPLVFALKILSKQFLPLPPAIPSGRYARPSCSNAYTAWHCALNSAFFPPGEPGLVGIEPVHCRSQIERKHRTFGLAERKRGKRRWGSFKLFNKPFRNALWAECERLAEANERQTIPTWCRTTTKIMENEKLCDQLW